MKASNLKESVHFFLFHITSIMIRFSVMWGESIMFIPELWIKSEAEATTDSSCSPLPLEGAGFGDKSLHQRTHLTALMVPEGDDSLEWSVFLAQSIVCLATGVDCEDENINALKRSVRWTKWSIITVEWLLKFRRKKIKKVSFNLVWN